MPDVVGSVTHPAAEPGGDALSPETTTGLAAARVSRNSAPSADMATLISVVQGTLGALAMPLEPAEPKAAVRVVPSATHDGIVGPQDKKHRPPRERLGPTPLRLRAERGSPDDPMTTPGGSARHPALAEGPGSRRQREVR